MSDVDAIKDALRTSNPDVIEKVLSGALDKIVLRSPQYLGLLQQLNELHDDVQFDTHRYVKQSKVLGDTRKRLRELRRGYDALVQAVVKYRMGDDGTDTG